jgi:hypothetical protein
MSDLIVIISSSQLLRVRMEVGVNLKRLGFSHTKSCVFG